MLKFILIPFILIGWSITHAQSEVETLSCPRTYLIPSLQEDPEYQIDCQKSRSIEIVAAKVMKEEINAFDEQVLNQIHLDNRSNPNFIAEKGMKDLREHIQCLKDICQQSFLQCEKGNLSSVNTFRQDAWCVQRIEKLTDIAKTKLAATANGNQARKDRTLLKQKFGAIASRFQQYFHHWMPQVINNLRAFIEKTPIFIQSPVE